MSQDTWYKKHTNKYHCKQFDKKMLSVFAREWNWFAVFLFVPYNETTLSEFTMLIVFTFPDIRVSVLSVSVNTVHCSATTFYLLIVFWRFTSLCVQICVNVIISFIVSILLYLPIFLHFILFMCCILLFDTFPRGKYDKNR